MASGSLSVMEALVVTVSAECLAPDWEVQGMGNFWSGLKVGDENVVTWEADLGGLCDRGAPSADVLPAVMPVR